MYIVPTTNILLTVMVVQDVSFIQILYHDAQGVHQVREGGIEPASSYA